MTQKPYSSKGMTFRLVALLCFAEVIGMLGYGAFPALLPELRDLWGLSNRAAGWVGGAFFLGYAIAVPLLVTLTDRIDARRIFIASTATAAVAAAAFALLAQGFWTAFFLQLLSGGALAGTYMVGLRIITDRIPKGDQSRPISIYTAHFAIGASVSILVVGLIARLIGWQAAFYGAALGSLAAGLLVLAFTRAKRHEGTPLALMTLLDPRPMLKNKPALGYSLAYTAHGWELVGVRSWMVAFIAFAMLRQGHDSFYGLTATEIATAVFLLGLPASVLGNEAARRFGRRRVLTAIMLASAVVGVVLGFSSGLAFGLLFALLLLYGVTVTADSGSLTAGALAHALPERRGATMAYHSFFAFGGGFPAPFLFGAILDAAGGAESGTAWGLGFLSLSAGVLLGPLALRIFLKGVPVKLPGSLRH